MSPIQGTRHELKMVVPMIALPQVRAWVRLHPAGFAPTYPPRFVNNIYFDTQDLTSIWDNLAGVARRVKIRLRWYGDERTIDKGVLELKCKQGPLGWKRSSPVSTVLNLATERWSAIVKVVRAALPAPARLAFDSAQRPVLSNRYKREYYQSIDGTVRLTVDSDISVCPQWASTRPNLTRRLPGRDLSVLEIKAGEQEWARLPEVVSVFPVIVTKHSKYIAGAVGLL